MGLPPNGRSGMVLTYNHLNLPQTASKTGISLTYTYDATGRKLTKSSNGTLRHYVDGIEYDGNVIDVIHTEEGVAQHNGSNNYTYHYNLSDLPMAIGIGNVRYTFDIYNGAVRRLQQDDYYAFGLRKSVAPVSEDNKYLYNGKELQDELGQYDYGARFYDPVIERFNTIDPLSEVSRKNSPYGYALNNPIRFIDVDGMYADEGPGPKAKLKKTTYTAVITLGIQATAELKTGIGKLGIDINAVNFDIIGMRDNEFVFLEGKKQSLGISGVVASANVERKFSERETGDNKIERTTTVTSGAGFGVRSISKETVKISKVDYDTGQTKTKTVSNRVVQKESWAFKLAALVGIEIARDVTKNGPNKVKKEN